MGYDKKVIRVHYHPVHVRSEMSAGWIVWAMRVSEILVQ